MNVIDRIQSRVVVIEGCHVFTGARTAAGYGVVGNGMKVHYVHRVMYEHAKGPIPDGLHIDHLCRNRPCCNPEHLEAVTQAENNARAWDANRKSHCSKGHPYTYPKGRAYCSPCAVARAAAWKKRKKESA